MVFFSKTNKGHKNIIKMEKDEEERKEEERVRKEKLEEEQIRRQKTHLEFCQ